MKELFRRLALQPILAGELVVSTLFITVLSLAAPLFVVQVLNRYVSSGFTGTLITLTIGMLVAVGLQFVLRIVRTRLASQVSSRPDSNLSRRLMKVLTRARMMSFSAVPRPSLQESVNSLQVIRNAYNAAGITAILDAPFALLFIAATLWLSPLLALIALGGMILSLLVGAVALHYSRKVSEPLQNSTIVHRGQALSIINNVETVRLYRGEAFLQPIWEKQIGALADLGQRDADIKEFNQSTSISLNVLMTVLLYAVGAVQVVNGDLSVGGLIGANILAGRAYSSTTRFVQTAYLLSRAGSAFKELGKLFRLPLEGAKGTAIPKYSGSLEFNNVFFSYPRVPAALFERLSFKLAPGQTMVVIGFNGSGKTTLTRLIMGLLEPSRGEIQVDGVNLRQIAPAWWRQQVGYLPQEPTFLNCTIREAITMAAADIDDARLSEIVNLAGLRPFLDRSPKGLNGEVANGGVELPLGIRRRLALARALAVGGRLLVFDEPTEGLDEEGCQSVYRIMNGLAREGRTMIVVSRDPRILKGADLLLDLSVKPVPALTRPNKGGGGLS